LESQIYITIVASSSDHVEDASYQLSSFWLENVISMSLHLHKHSYVSATLNCFESFLNFFAPQFSHAHHCAPY